MTNTVVPHLIEKRHHWLKQWRAWRWSLCQINRLKLWGRFDGSITLKGGFISLLCSLLKLWSNPVTRYVSIAFSITYREVCTYPLIVTFRQFRLANINPTAGFYRGVPWCFLLLFLHTYKLHFYSILVQDEDLKNAEALLRKTCRGKDWPFFFFFCWAGTFISQVYSNVFTYTLPGVFVLRLKLSTYRTHACYMS